MELTGYNPSTRRLMTPELAEEISLLMPPRYQSHSEWRLAYSLEQNGASLRTLYECVVPPKGPEPGYVLVIKDKAGTIFGAYSNTAPLPHERFFGNGDCFLWRSVRQKNGHRFEGFPYTGLNDFCIHCSPSHLSFGTSDGHYAIWVDDYLDRGVSWPTQTYGNPELSGEGSNKFRVLALEVWMV